jgi:murein endopeptidase
MMIRRLLVITVLLGSVGTARAESILVESGQTLNRIAKRTGCSVEQLQRANDLKDETIYAGQTLMVPAVCPKDDPKDKKDRKRKKRNVDDIAAMYDLHPAGKVKAKKGQSIGRPWDGSLENGVQLPKAKGYFIRHPSRSWGTTHEVAQIQRAIKAVRRRFPKVHTLAIGDLSAETGGDISDHHSHESGRDADIGFYFKKKPANYPDTFTSYKSAELDMAATWALVYAFARTADQPNGVKVIYLDTAVQKKLYEWAKDHGVPQKYLEKVFQCAGGSLVKHEEDHENHIHVRFKCPENDSKCQG